ncbi:hypothetical protein [Bifidobacterium subtile]|jgi:hypothetical protein|uniref:hypothetical protein n=1 Tax=Bifidobacterium subtile TaxID=77635 RepID=UPI002F35CA0B
MHPAGDGTATLIDVILNYFGESPDVNSVTALSNRQFEEFGELAVESAKAHYNSIPSKTDKPVYPGGFLSTFWSDNTFQPLLSAQLLYQPCLMLHDPIADFFNVTNTSWIPDMHEVRERLPDGRISIGLGNIIKCWIEDQTYAKFKKTSDFQSAKLVVGGIIHRVMALAPLIQHGVIILRPQYPIVEQNLQRILTSSRHDIKNHQMLETAETANMPTRWDNIRGLHVHIQGATVVEKDKPWEWQPEFFYLAKCITVAHAYQAVYVPVYEADLQLLRAKATQIPSTDSIFFSQNGRGELLQQIQQVLLPTSNLDPSTTVKMREDEEAFADWRRFLRELSTTQDNISPTDRNLLIADKVQNLTKRTTELHSFNSKATKATKTALVESAAQFISETLSGANPSQALAHTAVGSILTWLVSIYSSGPHDRTRIIQMLQASN